ncbi:hypothetical protein [Streptomyces sp. NPDC057702]|uniref:hypothetical protein n=1 Tax=unclassified Streptomyces TaxID=2593676 RepID=UPI00367460D4
MTSSGTSSHAFGAPGPGGAVTTADRAWLALACRLARECPPSATALSVGVVIVAADGTELARGHSRERDPRDHAEESALGKLAVDDPRLATATVYASLAPCSRRRSRLRSCTRLLAEAGVSRVVTARLDPAPPGAPPHEAGQLAVGMTVLVLPEYAPAALAPNAHLRGPADRPTRPGDHDTP